MESEWTFWSTKNLYHSLKIFGNFITKVLILHLGRVFRRVSTSRNLVARSALWAYVVCFSDEDSLVTSDRAADFGSLIHFYFVATSKENQSNCFTFSVASDSQKWKSSARLRSSDRTGRTTKVTQVKTHLYEVWGNTSWTRPGYNHAKPVGNQCSMALRLSTIIDYGKINV